MKVPVEIRREYELKRSRAAEECEKRRIELYAKEPELYALSEERRSLAFSFGRAKLEGREADANEAYAAILALKAAEAGRLAALGLDEGYLSPRYECAKCKDTGYLDDLRRKPCRCLIDRTLRYRYSLSSVDPSQRFEAFDPSVFKEEQVRRQMLRMRDFCVEYADGFPDNRQKNLLMFGPVGVGKTFLLDCIAVRVIERGFSVLKLTAYNFINHVMDGLKSGEGAPTFMEPEPLIIDDLGTEPVIPNVTVEHFHAVISERSAAGRHMAFATNLNVQELTDFYGERTISRLLAPKNGLARRLTGSDLRMAQQR